LQGSFPALHIKPRLFGDLLEEGFVHISGELRPLFAIEDVDEVPELALGTCRQRGALLLYEFIPAAGPLGVRF